MKAAKITTKKQVANLFTYQNNELYWKVSPSRRASIGTLAGTINSDGYRQIAYKGKIYRSHRLIFLLHYGYSPKEVDHIDGDRCNNKITNLRGCTSSQNSQNMKLSKRNTSGVKGVYWHNQSRQWLARVMVRGITHSLGLFDDIEVAAQIIRIKRINLHGEFANHG